MSDLELIYLSWEGSPGLMVMDHKAKELTVYEFADGAWREARSNGADFGAYGSVLKEDVFARMFPQIDGLPDGVSRPSA